MKKKRVENASETFSSDLAVSISQNTVWAASFSSNGEIHTKSFPPLHLYKNLLDWRQALGRDLDLETQLRLAELFFTAHTRVASLPADVLALDDQNLVSWLLSAAVRQEAGQDGYPLFQSGMDFAAYDFARLPDDQITITELPRKILNATIREAVAANVFNEREVNQLTDNPEDAQPVFVHHVETRNRAAARYLLSVRSDLEAKRDLDNILILTINQDGASFALWNSQQTFYYELGEIFRVEFNQEEVPDGMLGAQYAEQLFHGEIERFLHSQIYGFLYPETGEPLRVSRIYAGIGESVKSTAGIIRTFADEVRLPFSPTSEPLEEIVVLGLLLANAEASVNLVPPINLALDLTQQQHAVDEDQRNAKAIRAQSMSRAAVFALAIPLLISIAVILGLYFDTRRAETELGRRDRLATAELARLKPKLDARASYEKTLSWYEDILKQEISLRQKQSAALFFPAALDKLYPPDSSFYISDMNIKPGGMFELKGLTRHETNVTEFFHTLEYFALNTGNSSAISTNSPESRTFQSLQLEFKQGSTVSGNNASGSPASAISGSLSENVSAFVIRGNFAPMTALKVTPAAAPTPVANPATPGPTPASSPATTTPNANSGTK